MPQPQGPDAIGFTAGAEGAPFGAGVIHAYLAADRPAPLVVAGISVGAVNAAAMQRAYRDLREAGNDGGVREAQRWAWFRKYLTTLTRRPYAFLWDAIPDQSDFFTNRPPVRDTSPQPSQLAEEQLRSQEAESRYSRFLLTKFGNWIAGLRVKVSEVAEAVVRYVRFKERYGGPMPILALRTLGAAMRIVNTVAVHLVFAPEWVFESEFGTAEMSTLPRPLFGFRVWLFAFCYCVARIAKYIAAMGLLALVVPLRWWPYAPPRFLADVSIAGWSIAFSLALLPQLIVALCFARIPAVVQVFDSLMGVALQKIEIHNSIIHPYALSRELYQLFGDAVVNDDNSAPHLLIVAASLQVLFRREEAGLERKSQIAAQLWPEKAPLAEALRAAMSIPVLLPPLQVPKAKVDQWISSYTQPADLDIIDGAAIRDNPLPAMFTFFRRSKIGRHVAAQLETASVHDARIHVVYSVPSEANPEPVPLKDDELNIVSIAQLGQRLARRRDTGLEIDQANFISRVEKVAPKRGDHDDRSSIFADAIAPERDINFANALNPRPEEMLSVVANGCRRTLERLYSSSVSGAGPCVMSCPKLLRKLAPGRAAVPGSETFPGLPEVCGQCTGMLDLSRNAKPPATPVIDDDSPLVQDETPRQRIALVTSGGVFRGSFHIGMIAALRAANVKPDLIVGASVGTLMGAAFAKMFDDDEPGAHHRVLHDLVELFVSVDKKVALTRTLKSATRELGIRGMKIDLSPRELRTLVRGGTRADPGYAAIGAPPVLVDAISDLFLVPYEKTRHIAARFVAGDVSGATAAFLVALKEHTLRGLEIERFVIGTSLLEPALRRLLGFSDDSTPRQPFRKFGIDFYATATNIGLEAPAILGESNKTAVRTFSFVKAALASSAFPAVFSTVPESEILPGAGRDDVHYGDGGMFDNLPFFPTIRLLTAALVKQKQKGIWTDSMAEFRRRFEYPDLLIVGALNVNPEEDARANRRYKSVRQVAARAPALKENVKIRAFEMAARIVDSQMARILTDKKPARADFLDHVVNAGVLSVFPTSRDHLNKTFAFCASTGLEKRRVHRSIADGCFRTFRTLTTTNSNSDLIGKALSGLRESGRVPNVSRRSGPLPKAKSGICPYYYLAGNDLKCPFAEVAETDVYKACRTDEAHQLLSVAPDSSSSTPQSYPTSGRLRSVLRLLQQVLHRDGRPRQRAVR
jgi:predicted acylesterase/phospholipase RssA